MAASIESDSDAVTEMKGEGSVVDFSASGYFGFGVFSPGKEYPWAVTLTEADAHLAGDAMKGWLGPVFEVRAL